MPIRHSDEYPALTPPAVQQSALDYLREMDAAREAGCFAPRICMDPPTRRKPDTAAGIDAWLAENLRAGGYKFLSACLWLPKKDVLAALNRAGNPRRTAKDHVTATELLGRHLAAKLGLNAPAIYDYSLF